MKIALQQGVGVGSNLLLSATLLQWGRHDHVHGPGAPTNHVHGPLLVGLNHGKAEEEEDFAKPRQIGEKHLLVLLTAIACDPLCCSGGF